MIWKIVLIAFDSPQSHAPTETLCSEHKNLESFNNQLDGWRFSFSLFWRFPDKKFSGFNVSTQGVNVQGSLFRAPVAFELDPESGSQIITNILPDDAQSELQRSNKTALLVNKCAAKQSGRGGSYCYVYRKHEESVSGPITPNKLYLTTRSPVFLFWT